jgi:hypothetical protein
MHLKQRSPVHAVALIGLLQLASGHSDGIVGALGFNNCTTWIQENINILFRDNGPLSGFQLFASSS